MEAADVRGARGPELAGPGNRPTARDLTQAARLRRRRALASLRHIAAGRPAILLPEILAPLGIRLAPRPGVVPLSVPPKLVVVPPSAEIHVAVDEQEIVLTSDVRGCIRSLSRSPQVVPPILLVYLDGRLFLNDGHHRLVASRLLGLSIIAEVHGLPAGGWPGV
jgi:hypothetical protein